MYIFAGAMVLEIFLFFAYMAVSKTPEQLARDRGETSGAATNVEAARVLIRTDYWMNA